MAEFDRRLLEVGCGTGRNLPGLLRSGGAVYAVDMDFDAVATARGLMREEKIADRVFFSAARLEALPFRDASFDAVHCIDVLHWASGREAFDALWMGCWRVLRGGGTFRANLRVGSPDPKWFYPEPARLETLAARCGGEWIRRSDAEIELRKRGEG